MPIGTTVFLRYPVTERIDDGLILVGGDSSRMDAVVVAVGNRVTSVYPGDTVIADRLSGRTIIYDGVAYCSIDEADILARQEP